MSTANQGVVCDGCGQAASPEHMARRLQRLEWATRHRPIHIQTVLLGAAPPQTDGEYFYSPEGGFAGEAKLLADVAGATLAAALVVAVEKWGRDGCTGDIGAIVAASVELVRSGLAPLA